MKHRTHRGVNRATAHGFSLVEIMVAVLIICIGLLGIAKMQALALSSSNIARQRAMAAFLAASLASSMHSNRTFWGSAQAAAMAPVGAPLTINSATGTVTPAALTAGVTSGTCIGSNNGLPTCGGNAGAQTLAGFDIVRWSSNVWGVASLLPNAITQITCPGAVQPASCVIQMTWTEQVVMTNSQQTNAANVGQVNNGGNGNAGQFETPTYTLYVEP